MSHASLPAAALAGALALLPLAAPAQQGPCGLFEAVEPGDTFAIIAARCGVDIDTLAAANPGVDGAAPEVASTLSLVLGEGAATRAAAAPTAKAAEAPAGKAPEPSSIIVVTTPGPATPVPPDPLLVNVVGQWTPLDVPCADLEAQWLITPEAIDAGGEICAVESFVGSGTATLVDTLCGASGVTVSRQFAFERLDALTMGYVTGEQTGVLNLCAPG